MFFSGTLNAISSPVFTILGWNIKVVQIIDLDFAFKAFHGILFLKSVYSYAYSILYFGKFLVLYYDNLKKILRKQDEHFFCIEYENLEI
jgi:hypothetical protein